MLFRAHENDQFAQHPLPQCNRLTINACQAESKIAASSVSFLDDLAQNPQSFTAISREQLLASLNEGDLISIGESHQQGVERLYIAGLYSDLATALKPFPVQCLVETTSLTDGSGKIQRVSLIPLSGDPVMPQFSKICSQNITFDNPVNDYTNELKTFLPKGRVLTHTGERHTLPFGLIYPKDFASPQWVDLPAHGTIDRQIPSSFLVSNQKMRSLAVFGLDVMLLAQVQSETQEALTEKTDSTHVAANELAKVSLLTNIPALQFAPGEVAHVFAMNRVEQSFPYQKAYATLLNHSAFNAELLKTLLGSPEMITFLGEIDPSSLQVGVQGDDDSESSRWFGADIMISERGTIFFAGTVGKEKNAKIAVAMISPTRGPKLVYTNSYREFGGSSRSLTEILRSNFDRRFVFQYRVHPVHDQRGRIPVALNFSAHDDERLVHEDFAILLRKRRCEAPDPESLPHLLTSQSKSLRVRRPLAGDDQAPDRKNAARRRFF